jgi:hypothetical protein
MNEIDFKKLLRQERQIARSRSRNQKHQVSGPDSTEAAMNVAADVVNYETVAAHEPYETLLANQLSERHQIHPSHSKIDSVYYTKQFLHEETCNEILDWLQTLPEYSCQIKLSEQEESKECCGKWTTLKHARRKGKVNEMMTSSVPQCRSLQSVDPDHFVQLLFLMHQLHHYHQSSPNWQQL